MEVERKLRKCQNTLVVTGEGTIAFGLWGVIKTFMIVLAFNSDNYNSFKAAMADAGAPEVFALIGVIITYLVIFLFIAIDFKIRLFIGLSAMREGMGSPQKMGYVAAAGLISLFYFLMVIIEFLYIVTGGEVKNLLDDLVSVVVDLTSMLTVLYLFLNAVQVKKIVKQWI